MSKFEKIRNSKLVQGAVARKNAVAASCAGVTGAVMTSPAFAALDLTGVSVDTTDYSTIATFLITALVGFWGIKKGLALLGR